jgi:hypothetical protein
MNLIEFCRALKLKSNSPLRDSLDVIDWPLTESNISQEYAATPFKAFNRLVYEVETLKELVRRLWDEFEAHQDLCKSTLKIEPGKYIDNDADDGWEIKTLKEDKKMDKQIKKVEKDVKKGAKSKAMKDIKTLKHMDKKFDKKIAKAKKVMKKKGC